MEKEIIDNDNKEIEKNIFDGVVLKIKNDYIITCDSRSFTLKTRGASVGYYPTIGHCFDNIFNYETKRNFVKAKEKDIVSVRKSIEKAEKYMSNIVLPLINCDAYKHLKNKYSAETEIDQY